jgi:protein-S-isoprenylcysteine O-methyltransferase Ste14
MITESTYRVVAIASLALCLPVGVYFRIKSQAGGERLARTEEGVFMMIGLRLGGVLAWVLFALYLANPESISWAAVALPTWLRLAGAPVAILIVPALLFWTFRSLGKNLTDTVVTRRDHTLVTGGPYRWVRHPFYVVGMLWMLSLSLLTANWLLALVGLVVITMLVIRTQTEEAKLIERFGDEYRAYARRTRKFFPRCSARASRPRRSA